MELSNNEVKYTLDESGCKMQLFGVGSYLKSILGNVQNNLGLAISFDTKINESLDDSKNTLQVIKFIKRVVDSVEELCLDNIIEKENIIYNKEDRDFLSAIMEGAIFHEIKEYNIPDDRKEIILNLIIKFLDNGFIKSKKGGNNGFDLTRLGLRYLSTLK